MAGKGRHRCRDAKPREVTVVDDRNESCKTQDWRDSDLDEYLKEKEWIRAILGRTGRAPRLPGNIFNATMLFVVAGCFVVALLVQNPRNVPFEVGLFLVSLKLLYMLHQNAKAVHFQFWMLSTIEWRLNEAKKDSLELRNVFRMQSGGDPDVGSRSR
jgi:hypothetical protein